MIQVENLSKYYQDQPAVKNISFEVAAGEKLVLLGTSGCGKTTTLKMINRLIKPSSGKISIKGKRVEMLKPAILRREIGFVIQNIGLFPHYTVEENMAVVPKLLGWSKARIKSAVEAMMEKLQLPYGLFQHKYPAGLSGGQQQRVGLGRALVADPAIILMDEPFGALDPITRQSIRQEFKNLEDIKQKTVVLVTHDVQEAFELGDNICLMDKGEIQQIGKPADFIFRPANEFVKGFIKEQRFLLLLKTLKIRDIFPYLPPYKGRGQAFAVKPEDSIFNVLEGMTHAEGSAPISVFDVEENTVKQVNFDAVVKAIHHFNAGVNA